LNYNIYGTTDYKSGSFELIKGDLCALVSVYDGSGKPSSWQTASAHGDADDKCSGDNCYVQEAYCMTDANGNLLPKADANQLMKCANGCLNGACIASTTPPTSSTPHGTAADIPGVVHAGQFDNGGKEIAYHKFSTKDKIVYMFTTLRSDSNDVAVERATDSLLCGSASCSDGQDVGFIYSGDGVSSGDWLQYTANVKTAGTYSIAARVASVEVGGSLHVELDGVDVTGQMQIPMTSGWQKWTTVVKDGVAFSAGRHVLRVVFARGSGQSAGNWLAGNIEYLQIDSSANIAGRGSVVTSTCNNNIAEGSEVCDGNDLKGRTCATEKGTGWTGTLSCSSNCLGFVTNGCISPVSPPGCTPNWQCTAWSSCTNSQQTRTCTDSNNCGVTTGKP
jgi:hypothetical protein